MAVKNLPVININMIHPIRRIFRIMLFQILLFCIVSGHIAFGASVEKNNSIMVDDFESELKWVAEATPTDLGRIELSDDACFGNKSLLIVHDKQVGWMFVNADFLFDTHEVDQDYEQALTFWLKGDGSSNKVFVMLYDENDRRSIYTPIFLRSSNWEKVRLPLSYFKKANAKKLRLSFLLSDIQGQAFFKIDQIQLERNQKIPQKEVSNSGPDAREKNLQLLLPLSSLADPEICRSFKLDKIDKNHKIFVPILNIIPFTELEKPFLYDDHGSSRLIESRVFRCVSGDNYWTYKFKLQKGLDVKLGIHTIGAYTPKEVGTNPGEYRLLLSEDGVNYTTVLDSKDTQVVNFPHPIYQEVSVSPYLTKTPDLYVKFMGPKMILRDMRLFVGVPDENNNGRGDIYDHLISSDPGEQITDKEPHVFHQISNTWHAYYSPGRDLRTEAIALGGNVTDTLVRSWREKGYSIIGVLLSNLHAPDVSGTEYLNNIKAKIKTAVLRGADFVQLNEPYFRVPASEKGVEQSWLDYFGSEFENPASSINSRYRLEKLRVNNWQHIFEELARYTKECNQSIGKKTKLYACPHSPLNYRQWRLTFPHAQTLLKQGVLDGIIGQAWSDTSRQNVMYRGRPQQRTFDYAFAEYSYFANLMRGTGKDLWFLHDPASDVISWDRRPWSDYKQWYEATLLASLFFPEVNKYEAVVWTARNFLWKDQNNALAPMSYRMEILSAIRVLEDMRNQKSFSWDCGTQDIAVPIADSMCWQYGSSENTLSSFFGLALPLLNAGVPIQIIPLERSAEPDFLNKYNLILLSYDMFKPLKAEYNIALAKWVNRGGTLVFFGGTDPYNDLDEWWKERGFATPQEHLLKLLGIRSEITELVKHDGDIMRVATASEELPGSIRVDSNSILTSYTSKDADPLYVIDNTAIALEKKVGKGNVFVFGISPDSFSNGDDLCENLRRIVKYAYEKNNRSNFVTPGYICLDRGKYTIAKATESKLTLNGSYIDVLDPNLVLKKNPVLNPGEGALLLQLSKAGTSKFLHSNSKVTSMSDSGEETSFLAAGPTGTLGISLLRANGNAPITVNVFNAVGQEVAHRINWDNESGLLRIYYNHNPSGSAVNVTWK
jgi:carbohydrate binding protein with CBM11 domain